MADNGKYDGVLRFGAQIDENALYNQVSRVASRLPTLELKTKNFGALGNFSRDSNEFQRSLQASSARVLAFSATAGQLYAISRGFQEIVKSTIEVEKALVDINVVLNLSGGELSKFSKQLFNAANLTGQGFKTASEAALEFSRQGLSTTETIKRTADALTLVRFSGLDAAKAVSTITATLNSFNDGVLDSTRLINKLISVDQAFAVSSRDIAEALERTGSTASDVGVDINSLIGLVTAAKQVTGRDGAVIGNALKTIFQRIQRPEVLSTLRDFKVQIEDSAGVTLSADKILQNLAKSYAGASNQQKNFIVQLAAGVYQSNQFRAILNDLAKSNSIYASATNIAANASDGANERQKELNKTLSAQLQVLRNQITQASSVVGDLTIKPVIENLTGFPDFLRRLTGSFGEESQNVGLTIGTGILKGLGSYLSGPGTFTALVLAGKLFGSFAGFAARSFGNILETTTKEFSARQAIQGLLAQQPALMAQINRGALSQVEIQQAVLNSLRAQSLELARQGQIMAATKSLVSSGVLAVSGGGITLGKSGIGLAESKLRTKSVGYVPELQEKIGAYAGGYTPGEVKPLNIPKLGKVYYNTAEKVKKFPGLEQPAILPPQNSKAGFNYRKDFEKSHGFNPYKSEGHIPNFADLSIFKGLLKTLNEKGIGITRDATRGYAGSALGSPIIGIPRLSNIKDKIKGYSTLEEIYSSPLSVLLHESGHILGGFNDQYSNTILKEKGANTFARDYLQNRGASKDLIDKFTNIAHKQYSTYSGDKQPFLSSGFSPYANKGFLPNFARNYDYFRRIGTNRLYSEYGKDRLLLHGGLAENEQSILENGLLPKQGSLIQSFHGENQDKKSAVFLAQRRDLYVAANAIAKQIKLRFPEIPAITKDVLRDKGLLALVKPNENIFGGSKYEGDYPAGFERGDRFSFNPVTPSKIIKGESLIKLFENRGFFNGNYFNARYNGFLPYANKGIIPNYARGERYLSSSQVAINPSSILEQMSKDERRVLIKLGEGASLQEISSEMKLPQNAVSTLIENAKKSFTTKYGLAKQGRLNFSKGAVPNFAYIPFVTPTIGKLLTNTINPSGYDLNSKILSIFQPGATKRIIGALRDKPQISLPDPKNINEFDYEAGRLFPFRQMFGLKTPKEFSNIYTKNKDETYSFNPSTNAGNSYLNDVRKNDFADGSKYSGVAGYHPVMGRFNKEVNPFNETINYEDRFDFDANSQQEKVKLGSLLKQLKEGYKVYKRERKAGFGRGFALKEGLFQSEGVIDGIPQYSNLARKLMGAITKPITIKGQTSLYNPNDRGLIYSGHIPSFANPKDPLLSFLSQINPKYVGMFRGIQKQDTNLSKFIRNSADLKDPKAVGEMNKLLKKDLLQITPAKYGLNTSTYINLQDTPDDIKKGINNTFSKFEMKGPFSKGIVPNFNNTALVHAINRENKAGIPLSQIRVGKSPLIKSNLNPLGLGVYNTKDEPLGLTQGIQRVASQGLDPKKSGIPNFATPFDLRSERERNLISGDVKNLQDSLRSGSIGLKQALDNLKKLGDISGFSADKLKNLTSSLTGISRTIQKPTNPLNTALGAANQRYPSITALTVLSREDKEKIKKNIEDRIIGLNSSQKPSQPRSVFLDENLEKRRVVPLRGPRDSDFERDRTRQQARNFRFQEINGRTYKSSFDLVGEQLAPVELTQSQQRRAVVRQKQIEEIRKKNEELKKSQTLNLPPGTFGPSRERFDSEQLINKFKQEEKINQFKLKTSRDRFRSSIAPLKGGASNDDLIRKNQERQKILLDRQNQKIAAQKLQDLESRAGIFTKGGRQAARDLKNASPDSFRNFQQGLQSKAFLASIVGPIFGGVAQETFGKETTGQRGRGQLAAGLGNVAGFAATGFALGGPGGAIAGGVVGIISELPKVIKAFSDTLPDLQKRFEELKDVSQQTSAAFANYIDTSEKLADVFSGKVTGLSNRQVDELKQGQRNSLLSIGNLNDRNRIGNLVKNNQLNQAREEINIINQRNAQAAGAAGLLSNVKAILPNIKPENDIRAESSRLSESGREKVRRFGSNRAQLSLSDLELDTEKFNKKINDPKRQKQIENLISPTEQFGLGLIDKEGKSLFDNLLKSPELSKQLTGAKSGEFGKVFLDLATSLNGFDNESIIKLAQSFTELEKQLGPEFRNRVNKTFSVEGLKNLELAGKTFEANGIKSAQAIFELNKTLFESQKRFQELGTSIEISGIQKLGQLTTNLRKNEINQSSSNRIDLLSRNGDNLSNLFNFTETLSANRNQATLQKEQLSGKTGDNIFSVLDNLKNTGIQRIRAESVDEGGIKSLEDIKNDISKFNQTFNQAFQPFIDRLNNGEQVTSDFLSSLEDTTKSQLQNLDRNRVGNDKSQTESIKALNDFSQAIFKLSKDFKVAGEQIASDSRGASEIAIENFRSKQKEIDEVRRIRQDVSGATSRIDLSVISRQAQLSRQQLGANPEQLIRLKQQSDLIGFGGDRLKQIISDRPGLGKLGLTPENLSGELQRLISEGQQTIGNLEKIVRLGGGERAVKDLNIANDQTNALINLQNEYNKEKAKLDALSKEEIENLKTQLAFSSDILNVQRRINEENSRKGDFKAVRENLGETFTKSLSFNSNDFYNELSKNTADFGEEFKQTFKDGFAEAATGAKSFGDALTGVGLSLGRNILTKASNLATDQLFGSLFGSQSNLTGGAGILSGLFKNQGGPIKRYAKGGYVNQGSGTKDDVPALLSGGEFVVKKSSTQKLGKDFLNVLNNGGLIRRYASGGLSTRQLDKLPPQKQKDIINAISAQGLDASFANEYFGERSKSRPTKGAFNTSSLLSDIALTDENNPQNKLKFSRERYFVDLKAYEKQKKQALNQFNKAQTARRTSAYISAAINFAGSSFGGPNAKPVTTSNPTTNVGRLGGFDFNGIQGYSANYVANGGLIKKYDRGGSVFGGDDIRDNIPAYLMQGEYVVNKNAVDKIGKSRLEFMNKTGKVPGYANGGMVGDYSSSSYGNNDSTSKYFSEQLSILNQINNNLIVNNKNLTSNGQSKENAININNTITVQIIDGQTKLNSSSQSSNSKDNQDDKTDRQSQGKQYGEVINKIFMQGIVRESRNGGLLESVFKKK